MKDKKESLFFTLVKQFKENSIAKEVNRSEEIINISSEYNKIETMEANNQEKDEEFNYLKDICNTLGYKFDYSDVLEKEKKFEIFLQISSKNYIENKLYVEDNVDAVPYIHISSDACEGYLFIFPPINEGKDIEIESINQVIADKKIKYGINKQLIEEVIERKDYCKIIKFAQGKQSQNGIDGAIIHLIEINNDATYVEDNQSNIDFKNLNNIYNIKKDTKICKIINPTDGTDGITINGNILKAKAGNMPSLPIGRNTHISEDEDGEYILASIDGYLHFEYDKYNVDNRLYIDNDVDISVGNLDFLGDIYIRGDVKGGFKVQATGNIYVDGIVEDSILISGGNITINQGVNSNNKGSLESKGNIRSKYIENCKVICSGNIISGSIINSNVCCNGSIFVNQDKGVIVGGCVNACNEIEAKVIGSKANIETLISLGKSYESIDETSRLEKELLESNATFDNISKNIKFLQSISNKNKPQIKLLEQLQEQFDLYDIKIKQINKNITETNNKSVDLHNCNVKSRVVFPHSIIEIGNSRYRVMDTSFGAIFRLDNNGDVALGIQ